MRNQYLWMLSTVAFLIGLLAWTPTVKADDDIAVFDTEASFLADAGTLQTIEFGEDGPGPDEFFECDNFGGVCFEAFTLRPAGGGFFGFIYTAAGSDITIRPRAGTTELGLLLGPFFPVAGTYTITLSTGEVITRAVNTNPADFFRQSFVGVRSANEIEWLTISLDTTFLIIYELLAPSSGQACSCTNQAPVADAGDNQSVECSDEDGASVTLSGTDSSDLDGDALTYAWSVPEDSGATLGDETSAAPSGTFPVGQTLVTLVVTDPTGAMDFDDVLITVTDTQAPSALCTTDVAMLWPPNHQMEEVEVRIVTTDACTDPEDLTLYCTVTSSEADNTSADGNTTGDVDGSDGFTAPVVIALTYDSTTEEYVATIDLRAERTGNGPGRTYSIVCDVTDSAGNTETSSCAVVVPHSKGKKK